MLAKVFQKNHFIGSYIKVILITGHLYTGILEEISSTHITLKLDNNNPVTLDLNHLIASETLDENPIQSQSATMLPHQIQAQLSSGLEQKLFLLPKQEPLETASEENTYRDQPNLAVSIEHVKDIEEIEERKVVSEQRDVFSSLADYEDKIKLGEQKEVDSNASSKEIMESLTQMQTFHSAIANIEGANEAEELAAKVAIGIVSMQELSVDQLLIEHNKSVLLDFSQENYPEALQSITSLYQQEKKLEDEVNKQLTILEKSFLENMQKAQISVQPPDLDIPAKELKTKSASLWYKIKKRYENIIQHNVENQSEKIHQIIKDMEDLEKLCPNIANIKRVLAYFYTILEKDILAIKTYREAFSLVQDLNDLYNIAVLAMNMDDTSTAYMTLEQFFKASSLTENLDVWYTFIKSLQVEGIYRPLENLWVNAAPERSDDERSLILITAVYLLKYTGNETRASNFLRTILERTVTSEQQADVFKYLTEISTNGSVERNEVARSNTVSKDSSEKLPGRYESIGDVVFYKQDKEFGFLQDAQNQEYYFTRSNIADSELLHRLDLFRKGESLRVTFESRAPHPGAQYPSS